MGKFIRPWSIFKTVLIPMMLDEAIYLSILLLSKTRGLFVQLIVSEDNAIINCGPFIDVD